MTTESSDEVPLFDRNPELAATYERGPRWFVPAYDLSHGLISVLLGERLGEEAHVLVVAAGGGVELCLLAREHPGWRFTAIDPSAAMLEQARARASTEGLADRVSFIQGYVEDAPEGPYDAATALLVLAFLADDGGKLGFLAEIRRRLRPGAPFVLMDGAVAPGSPFEEALRLYEAAARRNGAPDEIVSVAVAMQRDTINYVSPERETALLREAGFTDTRLFLKAFMIHGWLAAA